MEGSDRGPLSLSRLLGLPVAETLERLGRPRSDRRVGGDRWLVLERDGMTLRVRARPAGGGEERVASWTVTFPKGPRSLREAAEAVGLWPACAPDADARTAGPLLRRPLPHPETGALHSLTARVRAGRIVQMTAFDEPPDWLPADEAEGPASEACGGGDEPA